jgi:hypothetical protein
MDSGEMRIKVLICGDRNWNYPEDIDAFVQSLPKDTIIIEGECRGADIQAKQSAIKHKLIVESYPAQWVRYGKGAGVLRNKEMLEIGKPNLVVAFHTDLAKSRGTRNMISLAMAKGLPVTIYGHSMESRNINASVMQKLATICGSSSTWLTLDTVHCQSDFIMG